MKRQHIPVFALPGEPVVHYFELRAIDTSADELRRAAAFLRAVARSRSPRRKVKKRRS